MKKNLFVWQIVGLTFTAVLGTLLHFLYGWTGLKALAPISAVNESTWEHMKLVFIPSLIFAIIQSCFAKKDYHSFWIVKLIGIVVGTTLIAVLFYTLSGCFGKLSAIINIAIFFVSVIIEYLIEFYIFDRVKKNTILTWVAIVLLIAILVLFVVFTFYPPQIPLFLDPVTNGYGITK